MSYRPITDVWILARSKVKFYGAYPAGFLHRARALLGVSDQDAVLHVCAGQVREYPYRGFGPHDKTVDLDPAVAPDYLMDVRDGLPPGPWAAALIDRPYTLDDADRYAPKREALPALNDLIRTAFAVLPNDGRVGVLDYIWPSPRNAKEVAVIAVGTGRNNRARWYTVWERER
uniref:Methyltransferase n=1 Tax=viral metagenome TaxID=1070528 RepID=A0A6M3JMI5_9ZZZZ